MVNCQIFDHYKNDEKNRNNKYRSLGHPRYEGTLPLENQKIAVYAEDGIGDQIFAYQLASAIAAKNNVIWFVDEKLVPLLSRISPDKTTLLTQNDAVPADHKLIYSKELIGLYKDTVCNDLPDSFLKAPDNLVKDLKLKYKNEKKKLVGIAWRSERNGKSVSEKCCPIKDWNEWGNIFKSPGTSFISLQYGDTLDEINFIRWKFGIEVYQDADVNIFNDIDKSSALIDSCDFIISISTTVAHIAGALGKKGVVLLPKDKQMFHWKTKTYPNLNRLVQEDNGDWSKPLNEAAIKLRGLET